MESSWVIIIASVIDWGQHSDSKKCQSYVQVCHILESTVVLLYLIGIHQAKSYDVGGAWADNQRLIT